jgi:hypothetical protein
MVQGNWERRAEMSETRRLEAKQRKQRNGERKVFKAQAQNLMFFLNRNAELIFGTESLSGQQTDSVIHIWTDTPPCSQDGSPLHHRFWEEEHTNKKRSSKHDGNDGGKGRRGRSMSFEIDDGARSAKNNKTANNKKKKFHPRSKATLSNNNGGNGEADEDASIHKPKLCRSYFFFGKSNDSTQKNKGSGGKKGHSCRFAHYPKNYFTIRDILVQTGLHDGDQETTLATAEEVISASEKNFPATTMATDNAPIADAMDMVYYLSFRTDKIVAGHTDGKQPLSTPISHLIVDAMAKQSCNVGSIVYFAVGNQYGNQLIYDRYRKGIVIEDGVLMGLGRKRSATNGKRAVDYSIQDMALSASILEQILLFLDDTALGSMSSVCRSWNREIGKQSGYLWRHLLTRRSFPVPSINQGHNEDGLSVFKEAFLSHYTAVRDINGIKKGIDCLLSRKSMNEFDGSIRSFESVRGSPQIDNNCVAVKIWGANSFLAAYYQDCSLRLFDSVEGSGNSEERLCRELICRFVDPYKKTKRRSCQLITIALDTDSIGCLLRVIDDASENEHFILAVLSRENFLIDDVSNDDVMQVIDIRQSVLNFLLSCDDVDHGLLQLHDFLSNDGDLDEIEVLVSQSLVECGYGRFMVEVAIGIPSIDEFGELSFHSTFTFRKLFIFSSGLGAITWMSDSVPSSTPLGPLNDEITLCSFKMDRNFRNVYELVSLSFLSPAITSLSVDHGGNLHHSTLIQGTDLVRNEILEDQWSHRRSRKRPVLMLEDELVVADNLVCDENKSIKSVVTFYPMNHNCGRSTLKSLELLGNLEACHLIALRTAHVVAICRVKESTPEADDIDDLDGHWFGPDATAMVSSYAIVIDVQSRSEIYRTCFVDDLGLHLGGESMGLSSSDGEFPIHLAVRGDTVVAGLSWKGVVLTGADARKTSNTLQQEELTTPSKSAKKAKKKKQSKKSGKKDGFARGQKM